jgi:phosphoribosyl-AMP cyclohydrolase
MNRDTITKFELEEGTNLALKYDADGLIPVIATDHKTGEILMFAFMNEKALALTRTTGEAHYWSRSRQELWHKGATSSQVQIVTDIRTDCDQDVLWIKIKPQGNGGACHVGYRSCFYRSIPMGEGDAPMQFNESQKLSG